MKKAGFPGLVAAFLVIIVFLSGCTGSLIADRGTLQLTSSPSGAEIYLDQHYSGSTPATITDVAPGSHTLEFRLTGYNPYSSSITVQPGQSQYFAALSPAASVQGEAGTGASPVKTVAPDKIVVGMNKDTIIVGDSVTFSGTCTGSDKVSLKVYGPGVYADGVVLDNGVNVNSAGLWTYTWKPGSSLRNGQYAIVVSNPQDTATDRAAFQVIGGGKVTVAMINHAVSAGDSVRFSGICTTGAPAVRLVLNGPGRFNGGSELGTASVLGDKTWSFKYALDLSMPSGIYSISVYDVPKTASASDTFTIGAAG